MATLNIRLLVSLGLIFSMFSFFLLDQLLAPLVLANTEPALTIWHYITEIGDSKWMGYGVVAIWLVAFGSGFLRPADAHWKKLRQRAEFVFAAVALPGIFVLIVKGMVGKARPYVVGPDRDMFFNHFSFDSDFASWPSGHTTTAFGFAVAVGLLFPRLRWPLLAMAALVGFSRMTLGVHYLGDVVMGAIVGTSGAVLIYRWAVSRINL